MATQWIPNYIKKDMHYNPRDILTAQEYNAILNLIITQGDYNSSWLEYLQNEGIPDAIRDLSIEQITEAITVTVREELAALSAQVNNKTSEQLNNPMVTILNTGIGISGISLFNALLSDKGLNATYAVATNLIDNNQAYPTLTQLNELKAAGNDIVAYSTDGATIDTSTMNTVVPAAYQYMFTNGFNTDVFVYPNGNSDTEVRDAVCDMFDYAVNIINSGVIAPDGIVVNSPTSILGNLSVINFDNTVTVESIKAYIDATVLHNKYMILQVNTDSSAYDAEGLEEILDYMLAQAAIVYPESIADAMHDIHETIGNRIQVLETAVRNLGGIYVTEVGGTKYLNW